MAQRIEESQSFEEEEGESSSNPPHVLLFFRDSELNETHHTRYDNFVAGGSDEERHWQWIIYSSTALIVATFVLVVLTSIVIRPSVRRQSFNLFLIFLMIPDFTFSFLCGINCAINAAHHGGYISVPWCRFQSFYCVWGIGTNAWLNGAIARHIHDMLLCSNRRQRYFPPTQKRVIMESLLIYAGMAFVASWTLMDYLPHQARLSAGLACLPHEYDTASTIFQWLVFVPFFAGIPTVYALYVAFDVIRRRLLPPRGRKRNLAVYFFRLVVVFLVMWVPSIFLLFVAGGHLPSWVSFLGGFWSHLQGAVSAGATIMKEDINNAFLGFVTCAHREKASDTSRQQLSTETFGPPRVHGRRSILTRPPSFSSREIKSPHNGDEDIAKDTEASPETEIVKHSTSTMEEGQVRHEPKDHDDNNLEKSLPPKNDIT